MSKVVSSRPLGLMDSCDIEVAHPDHQFFLANGLLTSNSSHSYCYSVMTMQCAHLATYHPLEFYTAVLAKGQSSEMQDYASEIQKAGIKILPVDINRSGLQHMIEDGCIRLALSSVMGVGASSAEKIVANRPYRDFPDFVARSGASKTSILPLIQVGAMETFNSNMKELATKYERYCEDPKLKQKKNAEALAVLWAEPFPADGDFKLHEKVFMEYALVGFALSGTPFEILDRWKKVCDVFGGEPPSFKDTIEGEEETIMLPVVVKDFKERADRRGNMMAFAKFGTESGEEFEAPVFSTVWKHIGRNMKRGSVYVGTFHRKDDDPAALVVGTPGFAHREEKALTFMADVDGM